MSHRRRFTRLLLLGLLGAPALLADTALRLTDVAAGAIDGLNGLDAAVLGDALYFVGRPVAGSRALYRYDGVNPPTEVPGSVAQKPIDLVAWNGKLYFQGGASGNREVWSYDPAGPTIELAVDVFPGGHGNSQRFAVVGGRLCFGANSPALGFELFCWDGAGPAELFDLAPGVDGSFPNLLTAWGTKLVFTALTDGQVRLWLYDGTNPPAEVLSDPGEFFNAPYDLTPMADELYFAAGDADFFDRIWRYDGLVAPTRVSTTFRPWGPPGVARGRLMVTGEDATAGVDDPELWRLVAGTFERAAPGVLVADGMSLVDPGTAVAFLGESAPGSGDLQLFRYCGRGALAPTDAFDASGAAVRSERVVPFAGQLVLSAADAAHGEELWSVTPSALLCDDFESGDVASWP